MRKFETLFITVAVISLIIAVSMPTRLIWLPEKADYWGAYRIGAFLHILILIWELPHISPSHLAEISVQAIGIINRIFKRD